MVVLALLALGYADNSNIDLPVALSGTEQWAGVIAKAMSFGAPSSDAALENMQGFKSKVMDRLAKQVEKFGLQDLKRKHNGGAQVDLSWCLLKKSLQGHV